MLTASLTEQRQRKPADLNIVLKSSTSNKSHSHLRRNVIKREGGGLESSSRDLLKDQLKGYLFSD